MQVLPSTKPFPASTAANFNLLYTHTYIQVLPSAMGKPFPASTSANFNFWVKPMPGQGGAATLANAKVCMYVLCMCVCMCVCMC